MRDPVRNEADAFHIAVGSALVIGAALALGSLIDPLVGVALCVGAVIGGFVWEVATKEPDGRRSLREAASAAPPRPAAAAPQASSAGPRRAKPKTDRFPTAHCNPTPPIG